MTVKSFEDLKKFEKSSRDYLFLYVHVCECVFILSNIVHTNSKNMEKAWSQIFTLILKIWFLSLLVIIIFFNAVIVCVKL